MPSSGTDSSYIVFDAQGADMIVTVYHQWMDGSQYDHATHRLKPDEVTLLRQECERAEAAGKEQDHATRQVHTDR